MEEMISEKKDRDEGSSSCSNSGRRQYRTVSISGGLTFGMLIAKCALSHVRQLNGSLGACIHEPIAALGMEFGGRDDFGQFFHVCRLDVHNVETLILDVEIPQVNAQVVTANEGLAITVDRYAVDVISVSISIGSPRDRSHDSIVVGHPGKLQLRGVLEATARSSSSARARRGQFIGEIVLSHHLE